MTTTIKRHNNTQNIYEKKTKQMFTRAFIENVKEVQETGTSKERTKRATEEKKTERF